MSCSSRGVLQGGLLIRGILPTINVPHIIIMRASNRRRHSIPTTYFVHLTFMGHQSTRRDQRRSASACSNETTAAAAAAAAVGGRKLLDERGGSRDILCERTQLDTGAAHCAQEAMASHLQSSELLHKWLARRACYLMMFCVRETIKDPNATGGARDAMTNHLSNNSDEQRNQNSHTNGRYIVAYDI